MTNEAARGVEEEPYTGLSYTYAYDFLKNEIIKPPEKRPQADDPNIWNENVKQIKSLLDVRGGADKFIYCQDMSFEKPNRQERKRWDNVLKKENRTR